MLKIILARRIASSRLRQHMRMNLVAAPVVEIRRAQRRIAAQDERVLGIAVLRRVSEIEAARDDRAIAAARIDDDDLVVRGGMLRIEQQRYAGAREFAQHGWIGARLLLVRDDRDFNPASGRHIRPARPAIRRVQSTAF